MPDPKLNDRELIHSKVLAAAPSAVFAAWADPEQLASWWGPDGFSTSTKSFDLRPGGRWEFTMHGPDGRDYPNCIEFLQIEPPDHLAYRHVGGEGLEAVRFEVRVSFAPLGAGTLLTLRHTFAGPEELREVEEKYGACEGAIQHLGRLASHLEPG